MLYKNGEKKMEIPEIAVQTDGTIYLNGKHLNTEEIEAVYRFWKELLDKEEIPR